MASKSKGSGIAIVMKNYLILLFDLNLCIPSRWVENRQTILKSGVEVIDNLVI